MIVAHLGSGASLCALKDGKSIDSTLGFTALDGLCMGTRPGAIDPGVVLYLFQDLGLSRQGRRDDPLQEVRPARHLRHQQRHARPARAATSPRRGWPSTTSSTARRRRSARSPPCSAASTASCSPPASARTRPRSAGGSARRRPGSASSWTRTRTQRKGPRISRAGSRVSAWVIPTNEELMIARHTGALLGLIDRTCALTRPAEAVATTKEYRNGHDRIADADSRPPRRRPGSGFQTGLWQKEINVRDFIQQNYDAVRRRRVVPRAGDRRGRQRIWKHARTTLFVEERKKGVLDVSQIPSSITAHAPGYIDRDNEIIVGLQTDAPLKRAIMPNGGFRMVANALKTYGYEPDPHVVETFTKYRKTHNDARVRRLHRRRPALPQLAHPHRPARRLRPRPDHRRLPPRRALRRRPADRAQAGGEAARSTPLPSTDEIIRDREELVRADPRAQGAAADGRELRLRHLRAGAQRAGKPSSGSTSATWPA